MIEIFVGLNSFVSVLTFALSLMALWALRSYALFFHGSAVRHIATSMFWMAVQSAGRTAWWDIFGGFGLGVSFNVLWNLMTMYAVYHVLKGLHLLLPAHEREDWSFLTVVFYPHRLWRRLHSEDE